MSVPLLAGRYKFVQVIGHGQSAVLIAAEVRILNNNNSKTNSVPAVMLLPS